ncbi:glycosyltransferase [Leucobacter sp. GX24907]
MRVLAVTPWFPSEAAPGSGVFNLRDVELLARDHEVAVIHLIAPSLITAREADLAGAGGDEQIAPNIRVLRVPFTTLHPGLLRAAVRRIRAESAHADLLHTMAFPALLPASVARVGGVRRAGSRAERRGRLPWVHTEHWSGLVTEAPTLRARVGGFVLRRGLAKPDRVVAVGSALAAAVNRYRDDQTELIANYVRCADEDAVPTVEALSADGPIRIVGVGGLISRKGPIETVEAVAKLRTSGHDARLEWAGTGPLEADVLARAEQLGVSDAVALLGHVDPEQLPEVLLRANVFVLPTIGETFGVAIAEALGHGLPVVTSGEGGHLEFLPPQASRIVARSGEALAGAVAELSADPERWNAREIIAYARERFSDEARRAAYQQVYESALPKQ